MSDKPRSGTALTPFSLPSVAGAKVQIGGPGRWQLTVVYRGKHCPICSRYLRRFEDLRESLAEADLELVAVSTDPAEKAQAAAAEWGISYPIAYDLSIEKARELGLYISEPRSSAETDRPFAEPGVFVTNPQGHLQIVELANAPFVRPDPETLIGGIKHIQKSGYPIRGTA